MTTATEYRLRALTTPELNRLAGKHPNHERARSYENVTRQEVQDELHDRALFAYHASTQGLDDLVRVITHVFRGHLTQFTEVRLIRALGVLVDRADTQDWAELATFDLTRQGALDALHELATRRGLTSR